MFLEATVINHHVLAQRLAELRRKQNAKPYPRSDEHLHMIQGAALRTGHSVELLVRRNGGFNCREIRLDGHRCAVHPVRKPIGSFARIWFDSWRANLFRCHLILFDIEELDILKLYQLLPPDMERLFFDDVRQKRQRMARIRLFEPSPQQPFTDPLQSFLVDWPLERPTPP